MLITPSVATSEIKSGQNGLKKSGTTAVATTSTLHFFQTNSFRAMCKTCCRLGDIKSSNIQSIKSQKGGLE